MWTAGRLSQDYWKQPVDYSLELNSIWLTFYQIKKLDMVCLHSEKSWCGSFGQPTTAPCHVVKKLLEAKELKNWEDYGIVSDAICVIYEEY